MKIQRTTLEKIANEYSQQTIGVLEHYKNESPSLFVIQFYDRLPAQQRKQDFTAAQILSGRSKRSASYIQKLVDVGLVTPLYDRGAITYAFNWKLHNEIKKAVKQICSATA